MAETQAQAKKTEYTEVQMADGRKVNFPGKRKLIKETIIDEKGLTLDGNSIVVESGAVAVRLDFRNGETRVFPVPANLIATAVGHGIEQKLGDETAGEEDVDDMVLSVDALMDRLHKGEWKTQREAGGMAGTSVLLRALVELTGKGVEDVKKFLSTKTPQEKAALRNMEKLRPIVQRIEAEKAAKVQNIDTGKLLSELA